MDLIQFQQNLKSIKFNDILDDSIMATREKLLNHNRMNLLQGKAVDGTDLGYYKYDWYAKDKATHFANYHAPYGVYNYSLYGDFQDAMYAKPILTAVEIGSTDKKTPRLERLAKGGGRVFGLAGEDLTEYAHKDLKPEIIKRLTEAIFKT